jgi:hypothetical protein
MAWLEQRAVEGARGDPLQTMYRIDGGHELPEEVLGHLDGYRGSRPVRALPPTSAPGAGKRNW